MPIAKPTAAIIGLVPFLVGLGLFGAAPAYATDTNQADHWETAPGEECVKYDDETRPFVLYAAPEGRTFSKVIVKAGAAEDQNTIYTTGLTAGAEFYHGSKDSISHVIVCHVPTPVESPAPVEPPVESPAPVEPPVETPAPVEPPVETPAPVEPPVETPAPETPVETPAPVQDGGLLPDSDKGVLSDSEEGVLSDSEEGVVADSGSGALPVEKVTALAETGASPWLVVVAAALMMAGGLVLRRLAVRTSV
ncbi:hypothetical protein [Mycetocola sp. 2940]|uniref:hypothetical protein n=1 Tax=Mycetocola sp. 2940 TaxID=3156452 RepID=UPI0033943EF8